MRTVTQLTSSEPFFTAPRLDPAAGLILATVVNSQYHAMALTATNGQPYSGQITTTTAQCSIKGQVGGTTVNTCVGSQGLDGGMTAATLSSSANLAGGRIAWMPRNSFRLPSYSNVDMRLTKQFTIHERFNLEFR